MSNVNLITSFQGEGRYHQRRVRAGREVVQVHGLAGGREDPARPHRLRPLQRPRPAAAAHQEEGAIGGGQHRPQVPATSNRDRQIGVADKYRNRQKSASQVW